MARARSLSSILLLLIGLLATLTLANPAEDEALTPTKTKCPKGAHVIAVRGHPPAGTGTNSTQGYGITLPLLLAIKGAIPHSTNESISYPKGGTVDSENVAATSREQKAIASYVKACPKTPIVLMGYSEGATITMNTVCGTSSLGQTSTPPLDPAFTKNVIAVIVYADGSRAPFQSYNKGDCIMAGLYPRIQPGKCKPYASAIQSYCNRKDGYCCDFGTDHSAHFTYFKMYDKAVAKFVKSKFKSFGT